MSAEDWQLVRFSAGMAVLSTVLLLPFGFAMAWLLARKNWPGKSLVETVISLPLVLPPVVTGLLLLQLFGRHGPLGSWWYEKFGWEIIFTWRAVVLALAVMSLPLFVRVARTAIESVDPALEQMARTLGANRWRVLVTITIPLARRGLVAAALLAFARALGEFGATIMVAGNIPGQTTTLAVAIYQNVQVGNDAHAWTLAGCSLALALFALWSSEQLQRNRNKTRPTAS